jgi:hypothetical protein
MWTGRDYKYGGLKRRYLKRPRGDSRLFDPLRREPVSFRTDLEHENWLLHWAKPDVTGFVFDPERVRCLDHGLTVSIVPDLVVICDGVQLQCVVRTLDAAALETGRSLERVANAYGCSWALRTREQIRANPLLLDNLERLRQAAMVCVDEPLDELRRQVEEALPESLAISVHDLRNLLELAQQDPRLDAVLIHMHWIGQVHINLEELRYDEATVSRGAVRAR